MIELDQSLPYRDGERLRVAVQPVTELVPGSPAAVIQAVNQPPHLDAEDVDELEREVAGSSLQVRSEGVVDAGV